MNFGIDVFGVSLLQEAADLFVHVGVHRQLSVDAGSEQRWDGHGLHGDELDLVGEPPAGLHGAGHTVHVLEDGRRGGRRLLRTTHRWGACWKEKDRERERGEEREREKAEIERERERQREKEKAEIERERQREKEKAEIERDRQREKERGRAG